MAMKRNILELYDSVSRLSVHLVICQSFSKNKQEGEAEESARDLIHFEERMTS